jgi:hypothetical protein
MTELELQLRALADEIALPAAPELAPAVRNRIRRRRLPRRLLIALVAAAAALGIAFAVPPARSALLRFFHLEGVTVVRVDTLPAQRARALGRSLGSPVPLAVAERRLGFRFVLPPGAEPAQVRVLGTLGTALLERDRRPLLLSEFRGDVFDLMKKVAGPESVVEQVEVGGSPGIWVAGTSHFLYLSPSGALSEVPITVHGNVLLWQHDGLTLRLQGQLDRRGAIRVAESVK